MLSALRFSFDTIQPHPYSSLAPMPILQSSIKSARQSEVRRVRRQPFKTSMKTEIRRITDLVKAGKKDDAIKALPKAYKAIDTAAKKNLIHWKNAARKKSSIARLVQPKQ